MMTKKSKESAEHYMWGNGNDGWHHLNTQELSVIEERVAPGGTESRHYHEKSQQLFYILQGKATFEISGEIINVQSGESLHIKAGQVHSLENKSTEEIRFLVVSQPKSHGDKVST